MRVGIMLGAGVVQGEGKTLHPLSDLLVSRFKRAVTVQAGRVRNRPVQRLVFCAGRFLVGEFLMGVVADRNDQVAGLDDVVKVRGTSPAQAKTMTASHPNGPRVHPRGRVSSG